MPGHPFSDAWDTGIGNDIRDNAEQYFTSVVQSVSAITTKSWARTKCIILLSGSAFKVYEYDPDNVAEEDGDTVIKDTADRAFVLRQRGDRYDLPFPTAGLLGDGEELPAYTLVIDLTFPQDLPGSRAKCIEVPTSNTTVTFEYSTDDGATWSNAFTVTFLAGERTGSFTLGADLTLSADAMIRPKGQATHDPTFAGFTATIVATRYTT